MVNLIKYKYTVSTIEKNSVHFSAINDKADICYSWISDSNATKKRKLYI